MLRQQCTDIFGPKFNSQLINAAVDWTNVLNGGLNLVSNRTLFPNGSIDPWSALGITTNSTGNIAYFIKGIYWYNLYILRKLSKISYFCRCFSLCWHVFFVAEGPAIIGCCKTCDWGPSEHLDSWLMSLVTWNSSIAHAIFLKMVRKQISICITTFLNIYGRAIELERCSF